MKQCSRCKVSKEPSEFPKDKHNKDGLYPYCKECNKDYVLRRRYGIDLGIYNKMLEEQDGRCAICLRKPEENVFKSRLDLDHCHASGSVRGLLCNSCNNGLGNFGDNVELLQKAISYLNVRPS